MRLVNYTNNLKTSEQDLIKVIKTMCKPWLLEPDRAILYRGVKRPLKDVYTIITSRLLDRRPKDMPQKIHDELNEEFEKKFGWRCRNGVFVTSNKKAAEEYSEFDDVPIFLPIGKYEYVWSTEYSDLFADAYEAGRILDLDTMESTWENASEDEIREFRINGKIYDYFGIADEFVDKNGEIINKEDLSPDKIYKLHSVYDAKMWLKIEVKDLTFEEYMDKLIKQNGIKTPKQIVDEYVNTGLRKAIEKKHEISFKCDKYLLVNSKFEELVLNILSGGDI